jgi:ABC-2 type transport system permease protein
VIGVELEKQFLRLRTYLALGLMIAVPTLFTLAFKLRGQPRDRRDHDLMALATHSGLNMPLAALSVMMTFLLPLVIAIFAGSTVAEESSWGTVRYLLVRPVSRSRFLASKLAIAALLALVATALISVAGAILGVLAFGWHPVVTLSPATIAPGASLTTIAPGTALVRLVIATFYVAWSMSSVVALGLLVSTMVDASMGAVAAGVGLAIMSEILDAITPLGRIRSVLPAHYWHAWESMFSSSISVDHMVRGTLLQVPYVVVFLAAAWWWFHRKDVVA